MIETNLLMTYATWNEVPSSIRKIIEDKGFGEYVKNRK